MQFEHHCFTGKNLIIFYHDKCTDGLGGEYIIRKAFSRDKAASKLQSVSVGLNYGRKLDLMNLQCLVTDAATMQKARLEPQEFALSLCDVVFVDFCLDYPVMNKLAAICGSLSVIDHHKTQYDTIRLLREQGVNCFFSMNESGTSLAWKVFNSNKKRPKLFDYIKDRDLWKWELPDSRCVSAFIGTHDAGRNSATLIDKIINIPIYYMAEKGRRIVIYQENLITQIADTAKSLNFFGEDILYTFCPAPLVSEVGNAMAEESPSKVSMCIYHTTSELISISFRSIGVDCTGFAKGLGGGGHAQACGATVTISQLYSILNNEYSDYYEGYRLEPLHAEDSIADILPDGFYLGVK